LEIGIQVHAVEQSRVAGRALSTYLHHGVAGKEENRTAVKRSNRRYQWKATLIEIERSRQAEASRMNGAIKLPPPTLSRQKYSRVPLYLRLPRNSYLPMSLPARRLFWFYLGCR
jgi:hypothetical protein